MKLAACTFLIAAAVGCHGDKAKTQTTPVAPPPAAETAPVKPAAGNVMASHNVAISADLATACGIKEDKNPDPHFALDEDELTKQDRDVLAQVATCLTTGPLAGRSVQLIGRADPRGTQEYNLGLGSRRAHSVGNYITHLGVKDSQLTVMTRGELDATGTDESGWKEDRRVDVELKKT